MIPDFLGHLAKATVRGAAQPVFPPGGGELPIMGVRPNFPPKRGGGGCPVLGRLQFIRNLARDTCFRHFCEFFCANFFFSQSVNYAIMSYVFRNR